MKATREWKEIKCAASLHVLPLKKYIAKAKCKDEVAEYTSELGGEEHGKNVNVVETNIQIKVKEEFPAEINVVNNDMPKEESSSTCGKDRYEYEEGTDEITGNKEIELANTEIAF